jgi:hypothetical protein
MKSNLQYFKANSYFEVLDETATAGEIIMALE